MILSPSTTQVYAGKILNHVCITTNQDMYGPPKETKWAINGSEIDFKVHIIIYQSDKKILPGSNLSLLMLFS